MESKTLASLQITIDQTKSKNPRPTGRGGPLKTVGEGNLQTEKVRKLMRLEQPLTRPFGHLHLEGEKTNSACSENFYTLKISLG